MTSDQHPSEKKRDAGSDAPVMGELRDQIDVIDDKLLHLINERLHLARQIGSLKERNNGQILDSARESQIMERLFRGNRGPIPDPALQLIFTEIFGASKELQQPQRVTYLGPEATFTHMAARRLFGRGCTLIPQASIRDVFAVVEKGLSEFGVVPVENSIEGAVNYTLDLFYESKLKICAETYLSISHDLLSKVETMADIKVIYSHPQAFAQCRQWLHRYLPDVKLSECRSTAEAAQKAVDDPAAAAAIASSEAAQIYNLRVIAEKVQDFSRNVTRFLLIGRKEARPTGRDKTSLMFVTAHAPGALYKALTPIARAGLNMVKLESRPSPHENWSYCFFLDVEGHMNDPAVERTVDEMRNACLFMKYLGSYPRAAER